MPVLTQSIVIRSRGFSAQAWSRVELEAKSRFPHGPHLLLWFVPARRSIPKSPMGQEGLFLLADAEEGMAQVKTVFWM